MTNGKFNLRRVGLAHPTQGLVTHFFLLIILLIQSSISLANNSYLIKLQQQAKSLKLAEKRAWQVLLHYQTTLTSQQPASLITNESLFFHSQGKVDPHAELSATLVRFFLSAGEDKDSAQCRFPARFQWLKQQLKLDLKQLPLRDCQNLKHWLNNLETNEISIVFPVAYLNNPASMFGHSFLKLGRQTNSEEVELLAWTINYAAMTAKERGLKFVVKGLLGGYQGKYTLAPYYLLLKEYADLDNRNLWEYQLNFNQQEITRLLLHLWELLPAHFDYYFINKNCSYQLLTLLEVARPELNLSAQFKFDAIPADTVRVIVNQGLLKQTHYRPALATRVTAKAKSLNDVQQQLVKALALEKINLTDPQLKAHSKIVQAAILELAFDYLSYLNAKKIKYQQEINGQLAYDLLAARSLLDINTSIIKVPKPLARPDEGHAGNRVQLAYGYDGQQEFIEAGYRWAYHDLYDNSQGFVKGAEVEFLKSALRYYPTTEKINLEAIELIKLTSLPAFNNFIQPFSWQVLLGAKQMRFADNKRRLTAMAKIGGGVSYYPSKNSLLSFNLLSLILLNQQFHQYTAVGMGAGLHFHYDPFPAWRIVLNANILKYVQGNHQLTYNYQLKQRISLSKDFSLIIDLNRKRAFFNTELSTQLILQKYF